METTRLLVSFGASLKTKARDGRSIISRGSAAHQPELLKILEKERSLRQDPPPQFQSEARPTTVLPGGATKRKLVHWACRGEELQDNPVVNRESVEVAGEAPGVFFCQPPESCAKRLRRLETWPFEDFLVLQLTFGIHFRFWPEVSR